MNLTGEVRATAHRFDRAPARRAVPEFPRLRILCRAALAWLALPLLFGLAPAPAAAQSPGVTLSGPVAAEGHGTAPPLEGGTNVYNYCAVLNAAPSADVIVTATPSPAIVTVDAALMPNITNLAGECHPM